MSANKAGKGSEGDDAVDSNSIAVLEPKVEIPLVDSTATLLTQSEKQTAAEMDAPRPIDGEDVDGSKDRAATGRAERSMKQDFKRIIQESKGQTNRLMLGIFFLILTALCSMFLPYFAGKMTDAVTIAMTGDSARAKRKATEAFYGILLVSLLGGVFQSARSYLFNTASYKVVARLRNRLFSNILKQEIGFFDTVTSGSLISRLTADTNLLKNVATQNLSMFLRGLATAVIGLAFMFLTSYRLTLVVIAAFPPLIFVAMWQGRRLRNLSKETQAALAEATAVAEDSLGAIRTVRGFAREVGEAEHFAMSVDKALGVEMKYGLGHALFNGAMMAAATAVLGATFWYGSLLAIEGDMTIGQLNAFILYSINSSAGLFLISATFVSVIQALGASTRVFELMDRTSRIPMDGKDKPGDESEHGVAVALTDVHFAYPSNPERGILKGLNLDVPAGHTVAIVGPSGAGKSTIASLVMRFYEPSGGVVTIGGVPVANIDHVRLLYHLPTKHSTMAAVVSASRVVAGASSSVALSRGRAQLKAVKMGKAQARGSMVVVAAGAVANGYASALVEACADAKALDSVHGDIETITAYMAANPAMSTFLANPTMEPKKKKDVLAKLGKEASFHPFTSNFLNLLVDKSRIGQLDAIAEEFEALYCESTDTQVATVTSAVKLENEQQFMIAKKIQEMTGAKNIKLKPEVDPSLLGGFVVTYGKDGSGYIDMSVAGQVRQLKNEIVVA